MATVLHSQLSQIQTPNSHSHHHHLNLNAQTPSHYYAPSQGHFFCKDCGVMFESSTSLEVHLSYHKENLLTRWASQDSHSSSSTSTTTLDKSSSNSSSSSSLPSPSPNPQISHRADNNSSVDSTESSGPPVYFTPSQAPQMESSQYLPPLYNNNTGDPHHLLPSSRFAPLPIDSPGPGGLPLFHAPENFHPNFHPLFSPSHGHPLDPHHHSSHAGHGQGAPPPPPQTRDTPAEILDLDSHKVHVYQHQQQQQQGFFHRPYLPHLLPPPPVTPNWPQEPPPSPSFRFSPAAPYPNNTEFYVPPQPQQSTNGNGSNNLSPNGAPHPQQQQPPPATYDIIRVENPAYTEIYTGGPNGVNNGQQQNGAPFGQPNGQPSPYLNQLPPQQPQPQPPQTQRKAAKVSPGAAPAPTKGQQRSPSGPGGHNPQGPPPGVKTKGWKGGECKRPKTYNCPACNKWFTSSGHLKRHYGTTLHKNSMKNLGENAEELLKPAPRGKKAAAALAKAQSVAEKKQKVPKNANTAANNSPPLTGNNNNNSPDVKPMVFPPPPQHELNGNGPAAPPPIHHGHSPNGNIIENSGGNFHPYGNGNGGPGPAPYGLPPMPMNHLPQHSPHVPFTTASSNFMMEFNYNPSNGSNGNMNGNPNGPNGYGGPPSDHNESNGEVSQNQGQGGQGQGNGPLPPFSSVGMSHYAGSLPPMDPYARGTPPYHHNQNAPQNQNQQISPQTQTQNHNQRNENGPSFEGHFNGGENHGAGEQQRVGSPSSSLGSGDEMQQMSMDQSLSSGSGSGSDSSGEPGNSKEVLKCPDCSKVFSRSCYLTQHANSSHSGGRPFKCNTCGKRFSGGSALSSHEAKHGADKPYQCFQCPKNFAHKTDLRRHQCLHTGERKFICNICNRGFIRKDHMTKHQETHEKASRKSSKTVSPINISDNNQ